MTKKELKFKILVLEAQAEHLKLQLRAARAETARLKSQLKRLHTYNPGPNSHMA